MATETKSGKKVETQLHKELKRKFKKKCKDAGTSMSQQLRDLVQKFMKES